MEERSQRYKAGSTAAILGRVTTAQTPYGPQSEGTLLIHTPGSLPLFGPLFPTVLLLNFGPCLLNLLVKFVFSRLQVSLRVTVYQGFQPGPHETETTNITWTKLQPPSCPPSCPGDPYLLTARWSGQARLRLVTASEGGPEALKRF